MNTKLIVFCITLNLLYCITKTFWPDFHVSSSLPWNGQIILVLGIAKFALKIFDVYESLRVYPEIFPCKKCIIPINTTLLHLRAFFFTLHYHKEANFLKLDELYLLRRIPLKIHAHPFLGFWQGIQRSTHLRPIYPNDKSKGRFFKVCLTITEFMEPVLIL